MILEYTVRQSVSQSDSDLFNYRCVNDFKIVRRAPHASSLQECFAFLSCTLRIRSVGECVCMWVKGERGEIEIKWRKRRERERVRETERGEEKESDREVVCVCECEREKNREDWINLPMHDSLYVRKACFPFFVILRIIWMCDNYFIHSSFFFNCFC